jgi:hypothetical protein
MLINEIFKHRQFIAVLFYDHVILIILYFFSPIAIAFFVILLVGKMLA